MIVRTSIFGNSGFVDSNVLSLMVLVDDLVHICVDVFDYDPSLEDIALEISDNTTFLKINKYENASMLTLPPMKQFDINIYAVVDKYSKRYIGNIKVSVDYDNKCVRFRDVDLTELEEVL